MNKKRLRVNLWELIGTFVVLCAYGQVYGQQTTNPYPKMAPLQEYLMEKNAEMVLAKSAAPESISRGAEILVLGNNGYDTAAKGTNGFVCMVQRSWAAGVDDAEFWNSKLRAPICFNAAASRSFLPHIRKKTEWALAGLSKSDIADKIKAAIEKGQLVPPETGAMSYMMSKEGYLSDRGGHWRPHLMFFVPVTEPSSWGANVPGSPVLGFKDALEQYSVFLLPIGRWSDGSLAPSGND